MGKMILDDLRKRLERLDEDADLTIDNDDRYQMVIVGGSAFILLGKLTRATHDIDALSVPKELYGLLGKYDINTDVEAYIDNFPYNYPDRLKPLPFGGTKVQFYTPSLEDLVIAKLCSFRDTDKADVESEAVRNSLDWDLLEHLATDEDELKASILNEWRYRDFYIRYQEYLLISRCKILVGNTQTLELHRADAGYMLSQSSNQLLPQCIQCGSSIRIHALVQAASSVPEGRAFALHIGKGGVLQRQSKVCHRQNVSFRRVGAIQRLEAAIPLLYGGGVVHDKQGALAQIKIRVQLVLAGLHQPLQGGILRFKVQRQPDALYGYLYFAIAVHVFGKAFQLGLQLTEKGGIRVGAAYHSHGVVRLHLGDPAPDKIPHRQQGSSDQHHIIPVVVPPVGALLRRGQGRGRFLDQVFGGDIPFVAVGCHGCVLVSLVKFALILL